MQYVTYRNNDPWWDKDLSKYPTHKFTRRYAKTTIEECSSLNVYATYAFLTEDHPEWLVDFNFKISKGEILSPDWMSAPNLCRGSYMKRSDEIYFSEYNRVKRIQEQWDF